MDGLEKCACDEGYADYDGACAGRRARLIMLGVVNIAHFSRVYVLTLKGTIIKYSADWRSKLSFQSKDITHS